ncbi:hypothetical protein HYQ46_012897 [Verticillium longisporum]|nr:hypothetical protein HYQ46_012897 [Verticillium longisporum]
MAIKGVQIDRGLDHFLQLDKAVGKSAELGGVCLVQRVTVGLVHHTLQGAEEARQANDDLVRPNDIFQVGLLPLETLRKTVKIRD